MKKIYLENFKLLYTNKKKSSYSWIFLISPAEAGGIEGYRGVGADFEKPKKYFRLIMNRVP